MYFAQIWTQVKWCVHETISTLNQHTDVFFIKFKHCDFPQSLPSQGALHLKRSVPQTDTKYFTTFVILKSIIQGLPRCFSGVGTCQDWWHELHPWTLHGRRKGQAELLQIVLWSLYACRLRNTVNLPHLTNNYKKPQFSIGFQFSRYYPVVKTWRIRHKDRVLLSWSACGA